MTTFLTIVAVWAFIYVTVVWPICTAAKQADVAAAQHRHPANWQPFDTAAVVPIYCEHCHQAVYHVATTGHDLLVVLWREWDDFDTAVEYHRDFECGRVGVA